MLKTFRIGITSLALTVLLLGLSGCKRPRSDRARRQEVDQRFRRLDSRSRSRTAGRYGRKEDPERSPGK